MDSLTLILILNTIMWYVIDNLKANIWGGLSYSRYITIAVAAIASFSLTFGYGLDLVQALSVVSEVTALGKTITALAMMGGSAVISEIVETLRGQVTK